jgi:hypothetical protein
MNALFTMPVRHDVAFIFMRNYSLLLLVTIFTKSFFALVRCHLVALAFFSARHNSKCFKILHSFLSEQP